MTRPRNIDRPARICEDVNRELRARGKSEILVKGQGYCYFAEGSAADWPSSSVLVYRVSDLTIRQFLDEYDRLSTARSRGDAL